MDLLKRARWKAHHRREGARTQAGIWRYCKDLNLRAPLEGTPVLTGVAHGYTARSPQAPPTRIRSYES